MRTKLAVSSAISVFLLLCAAVAAEAQAAGQGSAPPAQSNAGANANVEPDLSITANVTARELIFEAMPNVNVEFTGKPRRETIWEADRQNLPRPVQPGVTYRDIGIRLRITSVFADIDRIVAEALGEVPPTDDTPTPLDAPPASEGTTPLVPPQAGPTSPATVEDAPSVSSVSPDAPRTQGRTARTSTSRRRSRR